jgi:hypothetical protein
MDREMNQTTLIGFSGLLLGMAVRFIPVKAIPRNSPVGGEIFSV